MTKVITSFTLLAITVLTLSVPLNYVNAEIFEGKEWFAIIETEDGLYRLTSAAQQIPGFCPASMSECTEECTYPENPSMTDFFCAKEFQEIAPINDFPPGGGSGPKVCDDDRDCDGIPNHEDLCPDDPGPIDGNGCPEPQVFPQPDESGLTFIGVLAITISAIITSTVIISSLIILRTRK